MLDDEGYASIVLRLASFVSHVRERRIFDEWVEAAYSFDASGGSLESWLVFIRSLTAVDKPAPSYVQVMTIHKSKGLEFDAVILPFIEMSNADSTSHMDYFESEDGLSVLIPLFSPNTQ